MYSYKNSIKSDSSDEPVNIYLQRPIAGAIVFVLYRTPITPNQLTLISTLFGIAGGLLLAQFLPLGEPSLLWSALCFYLKDIFDSADGQLARAKQQFSRRGRFYDSLGDFIANLFLSGGITFFLLHSGNSFLFSVLIGAGIFISINLRVSYHVYYQTSFLHQQKKYLNNRVSEEFSFEEDEDTFTLRLHTLFLFLYGWQDRLMHTIDAWCRKEKQFDDEVWYQNKIGLLLGGFLGLGTEHIVLTLCLISQNVWLYLFFSLIVLNGIWSGVIVWRKYS